LVSILLYKLKFETKYSIVISKLELTEAISKNAPTLTDLTIAINRKWKLSALG